MRYPLQCPAASYPHSLQEEVEEGPEGTGGREALPQPLVCGTPLSMQSGVDLNAGGSAK